MIVLASRNGATERVAITTWREPARLRVDDVWHDVKTKQDVVTLLEAAGYQDVRLIEPRAFP